METSTDELERVRRIFDEHANHSAPVPYIYEPLVLKALRELGLTPSEGELSQLIRELDTNGDGIIEFNEFVQYYETMKANTVTEEQIRVAFELFDADGSGYLDREEFANAMTSFGETLSEVEIQALFEEADAQGMGSTGGDGRIDLHEFINFILTRNQAARVPTPPPATDELEKGVALVRAEVQRFRSIQQQEFEERMNKQQGEENITGDLADIQKTLAGSHIFFLSYHCGTFDRLAELTSVVASFPEEHAAGAGFYKVKFRPMLHSAAPFHLCLNKEDFQVASVRRLVGQTCNLEINNIVMGIDTGDASYVIRGDPLQPGGGSFLEQLCAKFEEITHTSPDAFGSPLEVRVWRQPDVLQIPSPAGVIAYPIMSSHLHTALRTSLEVYTKKTDKTGGTVLSGKEVLQLFFSGRSEGSKPDKVKVDLVSHTISHSGAEDTILVMQVKDSGGMSNRCGVLIDCCNFDFTTDSPLGLYRWTSDSKRWEGFSHTSTPVMMQLSSAPPLPNGRYRVDKILVEIHVSGHYYIANDHTELILNEKNIFGRSKTFEETGKSKPGSMFIRPWGWTRKEFFLARELDPDTISMYHGNEFNYPVHFFESADKPPAVAAKRPEARNVDLPSSEWRPQGLAPTDWEICQDGSQEVRALLMSSTVNLSAHWQFYQYYSLLKGADHQHIRDMAKDLWFRIPPKAGKPYVRMSVVCRVPSKVMQDVSHPFASQVPSIDKDCRGESKVLFRVPETAVQPLGMLLKKYNEPPEAAVRTMFDTLQDPILDLKLPVGTRVVCRNHPSAPWEHGTIVAVEGDKAIIQPYNSDERVTFLHVEVDPAPPPEEIDEGTVAPTRQISSIGGDSHSMQDGVDRAPSMLRTPKGSKKELRKEEPSQAEPETAPTPPPTSQPPQLPKQAPASKKGCCDGCCTM